jgi:alpha-mannosidase
LPGACKNYFTVQRWVDVSNADYGVTWATVDAPLIEVGAITCDPRAEAVGWLKHIEPSTTEPHRKFESGRAAQFGVERSQPLVVVPVDVRAPIHRSILEVDPVSVIVTAFKPDLDGKAWVIRLFNAGGRPEKATLAWADPVPRTVWLSNLAEEEVCEISRPVELAAQEIVTLRVPLSGK